MKITDLNWSSVHLRNYNNLDEYKRAIPIANTNIFLQKQKLTLNAYKGIQDLSLVEMKDLRTDKSKVYKITDPNYSYLTITMISKRNKKSYGGN